MKGLLEISGNPGITATGNNGVVAGSYLAGAWDKTQMNKRSLRSPIK